MKRFWSELNPTLRGFLVIALIAGVIVALSLENTLTALFLLARIAMLLAIAFFVYLVWRERRSDIAAWPDRSRYTFYGAALLIVADLLAWQFAHLTRSLDAFAFVVVLILCGFAMWRVWRDQTTYS
jgi:ABC-type nickel/cobalt efflux system permease component RcnA